MGVLRWAVRIHKWVALIVGLQILIWVAGGVVMSFISIEKVRGEHKIAATELLVMDPSELISLSDAADSVGISNLSDASLGQVTSTPVWRLKSPDGASFVVDAKSGASLSPVSEQLAIEIAKSDYSGSGALDRIENIENPPGEYGRPGPVWQVTFTDGDATTLYIDPATAEVRARRSSTWRFYDFFWRLHIMDYDDGEDFNHPLLITAAGAALFVAFSGLILLFIKTRRTLIAWRRRRHHL